MKKLILLSLIITAPAFGWDLNSLWKPTTETLQNAWQSMSPAMQKVTIAAGVFAAGSAVYAAWPIKKQAAYEKAENCAQHEINQRGNAANLADNKNNISRGWLGRIKSEKFTFPYGWFWQNEQNKFSVHVDKGPLNSSSQVQIDQISGGKVVAILTYTKENEEKNEWSRKHTEKFFADIKDIKEKLD